MNPYDDNNYFGPIGDSPEDNYESFESKRIRERAEEERALRPYSQKALREKELQDVANNERWVANKYICLERNYMNYHCG